MLSLKRDSMSPISETLTVNLSFRTPPNVVEVDDFKKLLADGWLFCIYCQESSETRGVHVHGLWYAFAVEPKSREDWVAMVTQRTKRKLAPGTEANLVTASYSFREFRTLTPIHRMCSDFGYNMVAAPLFSGEAIFLEKMA